MHANNCVDDSLLFNMEDEEEEELLVVIICRSVPSSGQNHIVAAIYIIGIVCFENQAEGAPLYYKIILRQLG